MSRSLSGNSNLTLSQSTNFGFAPSLGNGLKYDSNNKIEVDLDNITGTYLGRLDPTTGASTDKIQLGHIPESLIIHSGLTTHKSEKYTINSSNHAQEANFTMSNTGGAAAVLELDQNLKVGSDAHPKTIEAHNLKTIGAGATAGHITSDATTVLFEKPVDTTSITSTTSNITFNNKNLTNVGDINAGTITASTYGTITTDNTITCDKVVTATGGVDCSAGTQLIKTADLMVSRDCAITRDCVISRDCAITGNFDLTGASTLESTLEVDGPSTLKNTLEVDGTTTLKNTLEVDGTTTLKGETDIEAQAIFKNNVKFRGGSHTLFGFNESNKTTTFFDDAANTLLEVDHDSTHQTDVDCVGSLQVKSDFHIKTIHSGALISHVVYDATHHHTTFYASPHSSLINQSQMLRLDHNNNKIFFHNLPVSNSGLSTGELYSDNGTLKVKT